MDRIFEATRSLATGRRVLQTLVLFIVAGGGLFRFSPYDDVKAAVNGAALPEESLTSAAQLASFLAELDDAGRASYAAFQFWDLLNPILIGLFSVALISWLIRLSELSKGRTLALLVPMVTPVADLGENALLLNTIAAYPSGTAFAEFLPVVSGTKFAGLGATLLLALTLAVLAIRRRQRSREVAGDG